MQPSKKFNTKFLIDLYNQIPGKQKGTKQNGLKSVNHKICLMDWQLKFISLLDHIFNLSTDGSLHFKAKKTAVLQGKTPVDL